MKKEKIDTFVLYGELIVEVFDKDGNKRKVLKERNTIVNRGLQMIAERLSGNTTNFLEEIAIGDDGSVTDVNQTALWNEIVSKPIQNRVVGTDYVEFDTTFNSNEANFNWREIGLKNTSGLFNRILLNFTKTSGDIVRVAIKINVSR